MHPLLADPWIAAQVDAAVAPYVGRLPAAEVAWMRDQLAETLASDERAAKLLRRARPTVVEQSGEVRRGAAAVDVPPSTAARARQGRGLSAMLAEQRSGQPGAPGGAGGVARGSRGGSAATSRSTI